MTIFYKKQSIPKISENKWLKLQYLENVKFKIYEKKGWFWLHVPGEEEGGVGGMVGVLGLHEVVLKLKAPPGYIIDYQNQTQGEEMKT